MKITKTALALFTCLALPVAAQAEIKKIPADYSENPHAESAKIFYTAAVEPNLISDLVYAIDDLNINYPQLKKIYLYINSDGGDMDSGQIAYWAVKSSKIPITTVNLSMVGSSATIIFCGAKERLALPGGKFLLHASSLTGSEGLLRPDDIDNLKKESVMYNQIFSDTYQQCTDYSDQEISRFLHSEGSRLLITDKEAQQKKLISGLADGIVQAPIAYHITADEE
ncbi:ATP-dependent Clp protease, protease subunit [Pasteurella testudinis DSM 23072]|uniref:ATP-dependent Clp protease, protease subunit n=1 Tax=Pasteurella testudinis DSM 23072 TaxID=1122938 RepID=A0A1W1V1I0_9PAST|nr:ATP-dependent Clp protease proteolytic subunit [Pasteurella testudinis]SMB87153.1 ATP-dependent Clp protease, protease subunit [Pasteurella testudinis DSM 23072]SUB50360.1 ATP-dependent Clp protease proteolytic subunit [Pasteurella testudinis]